MWILTSVFWCYSNRNYALDSCVTTKLVGFVGSNYSSTHKYCCINLGLSCALTFFFGHNPSPAKSVLMYFSAHQIRLSVNSWILKFLFWKLSHFSWPCAQATPPDHSRDSSNPCFWTLQTMAWFWEASAVYNPLAFWILGDFCTHPPLLRTNPVEWCNANFAPETGGSWTSGTPRTKSYKAICGALLLCCQWNGLLHWNLCLWNPEGFYIHHTCWKLDIAVWCCMHISTHLGNWTKGYNGPAL